jgi:hypothetical protein
VGGRRRSPALLDNTESNCATTRQFVINLLAASTGLRMGEVRGLLVEGMFSPTILKYVIAGKTTAG